MARKINPNGLRYGINKNWNSRWIAADNKQTALWIVQDEKIRKHLLKTYNTAQIANVEIERTAKSITVFIYCSQPGIILGKEETNIPIVKLAINKIVGRKTNVIINVIAHENPSLSARIIAREIADAIENRVSFRNAQKMAISKVMGSGAIGVKTSVAGRLAGAEMARTEGYSKGIIPLTTLRADIDFAIEEAHTTYGIIGVKVWINRGLIFKKGLNNSVLPRPKFESKGFGFQNKKRNDNKFHKPAQTEQNQSNVAKTTNEKGEK